MYSHGPVLFYFCINLAKRSLADRNVIQGATFYFEYILELVHFQFQVHIHIYSHFNQQLT